MIIYGSKAKQLAKIQLIEPCPNCHTSNSIDLYVFQKYAHVFWIPIFPIGKTGVSQCSHCKQTLKLKEMPTSLNQAYHDAVAQTKTPLWMYSGLALLTVVIISIIVSSKLKDQQNSKLIASPKGGDIFEIKLKSNQYTLYKVQEVSGDSVYISPNDFETNKISGLKDLRNKAYSEDNLIFTKKELKDMLNDGEIMDIDRK